MRFIATLVLLFILAGNGFCQKPFYEDYLMPEDYVGWVRVIHEVEGAPPLPVENERTIYKFDESGILETSNKLLAGSFYPKYYYYTDTTKTRLPDKARGAGGMIHDKGVVNVKILDFFVGTDHQHSLWYQSECGKEKDNNGYKPGNIKKCLEDFENGKQEKAPLDYSPEVPVTNPPAEGKQQ